MKSCTAERGSFGMSCWFLLPIQELGDIKQEADLKKTKTC